MGIRIITDEKALRKADNIGLGWKRNGSHNSIDDYSLFNPHVSKKGIDLLTFYEDNDVEIYLDIDGFRDLCDDAKEELNIDNYDDDDDIPDYDEIYDTAVALGKSYENPIVCIRGSFLDKDFAEEGFEVMERYVMELYDDDRKYFIVEETSVNESKKSARKSLSDVNAMIDLSCLTRKQAVKIIGEKLVRKVDSADAFFDHESSVLDDDKREVWYADIDLREYPYDVSQGFTVLRAVYYQVSTMYDGYNDIDLGSLDWDIDHYEIE